MQWFSQRGMFLVRVQVQVEPERRHLLVGSQSVTLWDVSKVVSSGSLGNLDKLAVKEDRKCLWTVTKQPPRRRIKTTMKMFSCGEFHQSATCFWRTLKNIFLCVFIYYTFKANRPATRGFYVSSPETMTATDTSREAKVRMKKRPLTDDVIKRGRERKQDK